MESNTLILEYRLDLETLCDFQGKVIKDVLACLSLRMLALQTWLPWYEEAQETMERPSISVSVLCSMYVLENRQPLQ